eukprot:gnl/TRDRNA2_/TRDRNA2_177151_c10_seq1.p1 gnl/TRDRNA2_/TRDRNA2_177151_c10~~gnl/TRDRNA2_/TRDRNA2_177151_c10_seq1.p1  ORF type:complete len:624 (-),score=107.99 gnl/TRDRNA2_/TRDRNA2_177151_c10_seq1:504-2375(-)
MIEYDPGKYNVLFAFQLTGSVFPKSFAIATPCAVFSMLMHFVFKANQDIQDKAWVGSVGATVLSGFSFILGFLVVFRGQQAYSRWWEGATLLQRLRGEWFNAFSSLLAFCNGDPARHDDVLKFEHTLARLTSLLHASALYQISTMDDKAFELFDMDAFDGHSLKFMMHAHDRCEIVLQWIQRLVVDANTREIIKVAPPILSRVYNQLGNGIVNLNNARKISTFPIPFPMAQMITVMLMFHWIVTAVVCAASLDSPFWVGILCFVVVSSFWSINYIATELEMPFGDDANDLPLHAMQSDLNTSIRFLLNKEANQFPTFNFNEAVHTLLPVKKCEFSDHIGACHATLQSQPSTADKQAVCQQVAAQTDAAMLMPKLLASQVSRGERTGDAHQVCTSEEKPVEASVGAAEALFAVEVTAVAQATSSAKMSGATEVLAASVLAAQTTAAECQAKAAAEAMAAAAAENAAEKAAASTRDPIRTMASSDWMTETNATSDVIVALEHQRCAVQSAKNAAEQTCTDRQTTVNSLVALQAGMPKKLAVPDSVAKKVEAALAAAKADADARRVLPYRDLLSPANPSINGVRYSGSNHLEGTFEQKIGYSIEQHGHYAYEWDHAYPKDPKQCQV